MARITKWRSEEIAQAVAENMAKAIGEYGLRVEGHAKKQLERGHGVLTGTLRRSIHTAQPGYSWRSDNFKGKYKRSGKKITVISAGPERGNQQTDAVESGNKITVQVGSGLFYALAIHQGWARGYKGMKGSFEGYHFITNANEKAKPELAAILKKYRLKK